MAKGVKVLALTRELDTHTHKRLMETAQFVMDVTTPGHIIPVAADRIDPDDLSPSMRSALRVRLMHAAIRHLICKKPGRQVPEQDSTETAAEIYSSVQPVASDGAPINQEDLAYTLMTFSYVPLRILTEFIDLPDWLVESFIARWNVVGHTMGVSDELRPKSFAEAKELFETIKARQKGRTEAGRQLTKHLLSYVRGAMPFGFKKLPQMLIYEYVGKETASLLGVARLSWLERTMLVPLGWLLRLRLTGLDKRICANPGSAYHAAFVHRQLLTKVAAMRPEGFQISPHFWCTEAFGSHGAVSD